MPLSAHETHVSAPLANLLSPLLPSPTSALTAQALQGLSAAQLLCAQCVLILQSGQKQCLEAGPLLLQPIADGELLPLQSNGNKLQHVMEHGLGRGSRVQAVMVGYCRDEDGLFEALTPRHFQCTSLQQCRERVRHLMSQMEHHRGTVRSPVWWLIEHLCPCPLLALPSLCLCATLGEGAIDRCRAPLRVCAGQCHGRAAGLPHEHEAEGAGAHGA